MYDLKLPGIEPARPVQSAAPAIDRAGAAFSEAAGAVGGALLESEMAQIATQTQEATLQVTRGLNDTLDIIRRTPYLEPARVKALFGGKVPPQVKLTEQVATPGGPVEQERQVVPMHEIAPFLFDQQAQSITENATRGIEGAGWQKKFSMAAAADVERARAEALDWQRAQQLADAEIRSVQQFHQAIDSRSWNVAEAILGNADYTMSVKTRETLRAEYPKLRTEATILDRIRLGNVEDLGKLEADIAANRVVDRSKKPIIENADGTFSTERTFSFNEDGKEVLIPSIVNGKEYSQAEAIRLYREGKNPAIGKYNSVEEANAAAQARHEEEQRTREQDRGAFQAPLSPDEQFKYAAMARQRRDSLIAAQEAAAKRAKEENFQAVANFAEEALKKSEQTGQPASDFFNIADIPDVLTRNMDFNDFMVLKNALETKPEKRPADYRVEQILFQHDHDDTLRGLSPQFMLGTRAALGDRWQWWMERWASARDPNADKKNKPLFSDDEDKAINRVLEGYYKIDPKKDPVLFDTAKAHLQRNLLVWRGKNSEAPMDYLAVRTEAARTTFNANLDFGRSILTNDPDTQREWTKKYLSDGGGAEAWGTLIVGIGAAQPGQTISELDVKTHLEQMAQEQPLVTEAWTALNPAATLDGAARAAIHSVLINPVELARIDERLGSKEKNQRNRVYQIVQDMQVPQSREAAAENEAKALETAKRAQVTAAGVEIKKQRDEETAAQKLARLAADKAERDRWNNLPYWEQRAEVLEREDRQRRYAEVEQQVRARVEAEDRERQWAEAHAEGRRYIVGKRYADDPVRVEMEKRIKAESRAAAEPRYDESKAWFADARTQYKAMLADFQAGDPETVALFNRYTLDSFDNYVKARREGKVR